VDTEGVNQADTGKDQKHRLRGRRQQHVAAGLPGQLPAVRQRSHAAGIDELQACEVDDYLRLACRDGRERGRDADGVR
jgi:hypothetical protein